MNLETLIKFLIWIVLIGVAAAGLTIMFKNFGVL